MKNTATHQYDLNSNRRKLGLIITFVCFAAKIYAHTFPSLYFIARTGIQEDKSILLVGLKIGYPYDLLLPGSVFFRQRLIGGRTNRVPDSINTYIGDSRYSSFVTKIHQFDFRPYHAWAPFGMI